MKIPTPYLPKRFYLPLIKMVLQTSWFPHKVTVAALGRAAFPTVRMTGNHKLFSHLKKNRRTIGMYDKNWTPEWALFWSHRLTGRRPKGWTIAHIWSVSDDIDAYTHPANLGLVLECFGGLTDKNGPLVDFLRWHAWKTYRWKPKGTPLPRASKGFPELRRRYAQYLDPCDDPKRFIQEEFDRRDSQHTRTLRPIMERIRWLKKEPKTTPRKPLPAKTGGDKSMAAVPNPHRSTLKR